MSDTDCGHSPRIEGECHECCKRSLEVLRGKYHALREAAGKVTCDTCRGTGDVGMKLGQYVDVYMPCPDCADLRRLLGEPK